MRGWGGVSTLFFDRPATNLPPGSDCLVIMEGCSASGLDFYLADWLKEQAQNIFSTPVTKNFGFLAPFPTSHF